MANVEETNNQLNIANVPTNVVRESATKKGRSRKRNANESKEGPSSVIPSEKATSPDPPATEASEEEDEGLMPGKEWILKVEAGMEAMDIVDQRLEKLEGAFDTLQRHTLDEIEDVQKELEGRKQAEFELKQTITTLECRLMDALSTIDAMKAKMEALEEQVDAGVTEAASNVVVTREAKIEALKPPVFKGVHDAQEVENFLWHLENYFKHGKVRDEEAKINTAVV